MFHAFRCVLDYCLCVLVGLDWVLPMMQFKFFTSHVHAYCLCVLVSFYFCFCFWCVSFLSLSLKRIDCAWHPSANLLRLRTLLVLGLLPLILLFPFFMFSSAMGRPNRTSLKIFKNMAFIWNTMLFYQTFPTFLSLRSFGLRAKNLFMRDPWFVPSCLYRSFTPINIVSIPLYLGLPQHFEVHVL